MEWLTISNLVAGASDQASLSPFMTGLIVFVLSCFVGYHVIWNVTPALHTPLMAVTNAISAVIIVGAVLIVASETGEWVEILGFFGVLLASINLFGGFAVTKRMLSMFKKQKK